MNSQLLETYRAIKNVIGDSNDPVALHEPNFIDTEAENYVLNCVRTGWVSSAGKWVEEFEKKICEYTNSKYAIAVTNGTVGLRLALHLVGVKPSDEVIIPSLTFVATANSISHLGGTPHFVDIDEKRLSICPENLEKHLKNISKYDKGILYNKFTNNPIKAIMPVHIFGMPADMNGIKKIANIYNLPIVEDASEALGSFIIAKDEKKHCGNLGDVGVLSFNGNKIITTGGGGALITNNKEIADMARYLSTTAKKEHPWEFDHDLIGWNDRMPNINAALGVAQLEVFNERLEKKKKLFELYKKNFESLCDIELISPPKSCESNHWLISFKMLFNDKKNCKKFRSDILELCHSNRIYLRPIWRALHTLPMYKDCPSSSLVITEKEASRIISLPSSPQLYKK